MSNTVPSYRTLDAMNAGDRWQVLNVWATDLRQQLQWIKEGYVFFTDGMTAPRARCAVRKRLANVYGKAADFGYYVGQPE